jgi:hypothetical protein
VEENLLLQLIVLSREFPMQSDMSFHIRIIIIHHISFFMRKVIGDIGIEKFDDGLYHCRIVLRDDGINEDIHLLEEPLMLPIERGIPD